jgi:predicted N-formylglutamate amidohydrolase
MRPDSVVVSCEHASQQIPAPYRHLFHGALPLVASHRGWDIGAAAVARAIARSFQAPLFAGRASRLLVDLNRSLHHRAAFSQWTRPLPHSQRMEIAKRHYFPYRTAVEDCLRQRLGSGEFVLHVSVHSFTPVWQGVRRRADIGLLYDPQRPSERLLCSAWKDALRAVAPELRVRRNYPYRGTSDGFSVALRQSLRSARYACVELEINQALLQEPGGRAIARAISASLAPLVAIPRLG